MSQVTDGLDHGKLDPAARSAAHPTDKNLSKQWPVHTMRAAANMGVFMLLHAWFSQPEDSLELASRNRVTEEPHGIFA